LVVSIYKEKSKTPHTFDFKQITVDFKQITTDEARMFSQNDARNCYEIHFGKTQRCSQAAVGLKPPLSTYQFRNTDVCFICSVNFHQPFSSDWMHCGKFGGSASRRRNTFVIKSDSYEF